MLTELCNSDLRVLKSTFIVFEVFENILPYIVAKSHGSIARVCHRQTMDNSSFITELALKVLSCFHLLICLRPLYACNQSFDIPSSPHTMDSAFREAGGSRSLRRFERVSLGYDLIASKLLGVLSRSIFGTQGRIELQAEAVNSQLCITSALKTIYNSYDYS